MTAPHSVQVADSSIAGNRRIVTKPGSRYSQFLTSIKLHYFETIQTVVFLGLLTDFAFLELRPFFRTLWDFFTGP